jgi:hypothetical protein
MLVVALLAAGALIWRHRRHMEVTPEQIDMPETEA